MALAREGVADLKHDTAWSLTQWWTCHREVHRSRHSNDGTTKYLDDCRDSINNIPQAHRKPIFSGMENW